MTKMKQRPYNEGDAFAVPLREGGFGIGVLARALWRRTQCDTLGYFFGPKRTELPSIEELGSLDPKDALLADRFGDLGLHDGTWPVLGPLPNWNRDDWPMPVFGRVKLDNDVGLAFHYDPDDPSKELRHEELPADEVFKLPPYGLSGSGAVEIVLTAVLGDPPARTIAGRHRVPSLIRPSHG